MIVFIEIVCADCITIGPNDSDKLLRKFVVTDAAFAKAIFIGDNTADAAFVDVIGDILGSIIFKIK